MANGALNAATAPLHRVRRLLGRSGRRVLAVVPARPLGRLAQRSGRVGALARAGLRGRQSAMRQGVGRGLLFDPGASNPDYAIGSNEPAVQDLFARVIRPGMVVYDVGANVGFFTVLAARLTGAGGFVYAFEPDLDNARLVRANLAANDFNQALVVARAVGPATGMSVLQVARYSGGHALAGAAAPPDKVHEVAVETVSLDDFLTQAGVQPPDFVKIDVEGFELPVLDGMARLLREHRPGLLIELDDATRAGHDAKVADLHAKLDGLGYRAEPLADSYRDIDWVVSHWFANPADAPAAAAAAGNSLLDGEAEPEVEVRPAGPADSSDA
ncbi:MAG: FkbM family methyltransferase [Acidimicrobiales bacterium]|nr:FkbM family methyltransferase [Acidimicrobiales bacterium]